MISSNNHSTDVLTLLIATLYACILWCQNTIPKWALKMNAEGVGWITVDAERLASSTEDIHLEILEQKGIS